MSAEPCFFDTNILVYLFDDDSPEKQARSRSILDENAETAIISTQVLGEFFVTVTRKLARPLAVGQAEAAVESLCGLVVRPVYKGLVKAAIERSRVSRLSYWDALIVETAIEAGAVVLLSEDMQGGQRIESLRIANPFKQDITVSPGRS